MLTLACALLLASSPRDQFMSVLHDYQGLDSFSATIEHQDDSGLFPGHYVQELKWRKDKRFELKVTLKSHLKEDPPFGKHGVAAPDFFCDGSEVARVKDGRTVQTDPINHDSNVIPGWEVSGGLIMSALMRTSTVDWLGHPGQGVVMDYADGKAIHWKGEAVHEIVLTTRTAEMSRTLSFYLSPNGRLLLGMSSVVKGKVVWMRYTKQKRNPGMRAALGTPPPPKG